jgi:hypothetical protein
MLQTHGRIYEGIPEQMNLWMEMTAVSSAILEAAEDSQCWSKHVACIHSDVEEILKFKTFNGFKKQVMYKTANSKE